MYTDSSISFFGWFVDDIVVYTCDGGIVNATRPSISGRTKVGKKLTAKPGSWTPAGLTFGYAWLRNGNAIGGATKKTYVLKAKDRGKKISVRVTARKDGLGKASATSRRVGPVR